jgi:hypothetical protein
MALFMAEFGGWRFGVLAPQSLKVEQDWEK